MQTLLYLYSSKVELYQSLPVKQALLDFKVKSRDSGVKVICFLALTWLIILLIACTPYISLLQPLNVLLSCRCRLCCIINHWERFGKIWNESSHPSRVVATLKHMQGVRLVIVSRGIIQRSERSSPTVHSWYWYRILRMENGKWECLVVLVHSILLHHWMSERT